MLSPAIGSTDERIRVALHTCDTVLLLPCKAASSSVRQAVSRATGRAVAALDYVDGATAATFARRLAVVRHPLDRLASCWADKFVRGPAIGKPFPAGFVAFGLEQEMDFASFATAVAAIPDAACVGDGRHFRSQHIDLEPCGVPPTFVGRFETLAESWLRIARIVTAAGGPALPPLGHLRRSASADVAWTAAAHAAARARYAEDLRRYGYDA